MGNSWTTWSLATKLRVVIFVSVCAALLIGTVWFLGKQEGLAAVVAAMLAGIPAIMARLKRYNQDKSEREASENATPDNGSANG